MPQFLIEKGKDLAKKIDDESILEGKNPRNIAGVVIYIVTNATESNKISLTEIAKVSQIHENTMKNTIKKLISHLDELGYSGEEKKKIENIFKNSRTAKKINKKTDEPLSPEFGMKRKKVKTL